MSKATFHLTFPERLVQEPMVHRMGTQFGLVPNIRRANIDERSAWIILDLEGADEDVAAAVAWLVEQGVKVDRIDEGS